MIAKTLSLVFLLLVSAQQPNERDLDLLFELVNCKTFRTTRTIRLKKILTKKQMSELEKIREENRTQLRESRGRRGR